MSIPCCNIWCSVALGSIQLFLCRIASWLLLRLKLLDRVEGDLGKLGYLNIFLVTIPISLKTIEYAESDISCKFNSHDSHSEQKACISHYGFSLACWLHLMVQNYPAHPRVMASTERSMHVSPQLQAQVTPLLLTSDLIRGEDVSGWGAHNEARGTEKWKTLKDLQLSEVHRKAEPFCGFFHNCVWSRGAKSHLLM